MTYAPRRLLNLRSYLQDHTGLPAVSLGIIGSQDHHATGTSYHIGWSSLRSGAYSRKHPRDTKLRTDAASATDTGWFSRGGKTLVGLTRWAVAEARAGRRPDTRELIGPWSDGRAYRWAAEGGWKAQLRSRGDSHESHLHESWYRDSEVGDKIRFYRGYFEEDDVSAEEVWDHEDPHLDLKTGEILRYILNAVRPDRAQTEGARVGLAQDLDGVVARQEAILAAVTGQDTVEAVREELDRHRGEVDAVLQQASTERAEILTLVAAAVSGEREAADVVDEIGRRLKNAGD